MNPLIALVKTVVFFIIDIAVKGVNRVVFENSDMFLAEKEPSTSSNDAARTRSYVCP